MEFLFSDSQLTQETIFKLGLHLKFFRTENTNTESSCVIPYIYGVKVNTIYKFCIHISFKWFLNMDLIILNVLNGGKAALKRKSWF